MQMQADAAKVFPADDHSMEALGVGGIFLDRNSLPDLIRETVAGDAFLWTLGVIFAHTWPRFFF